MARRLGTELGLSLGDRVRVVPTQGLQRPVEMTVAGFIDSLFGLCVYADYDYLNRQIGEAGALSILQLKGKPAPLMGPHVSSPDQSLARSGQLC